MNKNDWMKNGVEHLERPGCIINIRAGLHNREGRDVTSVEILPDTGWKLDAYRVVKDASKDEE